MARTRITYFFDADGPGWSESVHTSLSDPTSLASLITTYTGLRRALLTRDEFIVHIRVSDDEVFRDIIIDPIGLPLRGTGAGSNAPPFVAALLRLRSGPQVVRNFFLRGAPTSLFAGPVFNIGSAAWAALNAFCSFLKSSSLGISHKSLPSTALLVQSYVAGTGVFTVDASFGSPAPGTPIVLTGVPNSVMPTKNWRIWDSTAPGVFRLQQWPLAVNIAGFGRVRVATPTVTSITEAFPDKVTERRVGRPFGLPRGRAANRV